MIVVEVNQTEKNSPKNFGRQTNEIVRIIPFSPCQVYFLHTGTNDEDNCQDKW